jgi:hypothetical protein
VLDAEPRGGAARIREDPCPPRYHRLLPVDRWHAQPTRGKSFLNLRDERRVLVQGQAQRLGDRFAGQVVVGGAKATREDHQLGARQGAAQNFLQPLPVIPNHALRPQFDAERHQTIGQKQGIGVDPRRAKEFTADGNDFGGHKRARLAHTNQAGSSHIRIRSETFA